MKNKVYYKTFKTPQAYYVYDRRSNKILKITQEAYEELNEKGLEKQRWKVFRDKGYLLEDVLEEIEHPDTSLLEYSLQTKVQYMFYKLHKSVIYGVNIVYMVEVMTIEHMLTNLWTGTWRKSR